MLDFKQLLVDSGSIVQCFRSFKNDILQKLHITDKLRFFKLGGDLDVKLQLVAFPIADFDWLRFSSRGLRIPPNVTHWQVDNNPYAHQPSYTQPSFYTHTDIHSDFVAEAEAQAIKQKIPIRR